MRAARRGIAPIALVTNMQTDTLVARARAFAIAAHGNQRYGSQPYAVHLDAVAKVAIDAGMPPHVIAAAYLHDVREDVRGVTEADILREFGPEVSAIVEALSKDPDGYEARSYFAGIRACGPHAVFVKLADRLCNARQSATGDSNRHLVRYRGEHALFKSALFRAGEFPEQWRELERLLG